MNERECTGCHRVSSRGMRRAEREEWQCADKSACRARSEVHRNVAAAQEYLTAEHVMDALRVTGRHIYLDAGTLPTHPRFVRSALRAQAKALGWRISARMTGTSIRVERLPARDGAPSSRVH